MLGKNQRQQIIDLINKEVVPALGCTEPVAVALATARSREVLEIFPKTIDVLVSGNIYKNGMGVGIPGTGMAGLDIAAALGAVCGQSKDGLEVLKSVDAKSLAQARQMVLDKKINISVKEGTDNLYVESIARSGDQICRTIISHRHTQIVLVEKNGCIVFQSDQTVKNSDKPQEQETLLSVKTIIEFSRTTPIKEIAFIMEGVSLNSAISKEGMTGKYGLKTGKTIQQSIQNKRVADDLVSHAMSVTAAASDARMDGCNLPVMSNSGSGNQGITTIMPVVAVAERIHAPQETLIRALILSNLMAIYIKQFVGQLTALCGILTASIGAACGICYLLGGNPEQIGGTIKNMGASITGMICDGAKPGCALKVSSGVSSAVYCALLALEGHYADDMDGIICHDVERTVRNIGALATKGMVETDRHIIRTLISDRKD
ncbi:MAG: L-serine ammonia-lyase, iron-sulfur-dependent, subunit alpha [Pseudomonadota bacterium]